MGFDLCLLFWQNTEKTQAYQGVTLANLFPRRDNRWLSSIVFSDL